MTRRRYLDAIRSSWLFSIGVLGGVCLVMSAAWLAFPSAFGGMG